MNRLKQIVLALTPRERVVFIAAAAAGVLSAVALTALAVQDATVVVPARGGEYAEGIVGQPAAVNPVLAASDADKTLTRLIFANLKNMADKMETDKNGRARKVRLKENLRWSDGAKITSDDVVFTVERIQDPETQSPLFESWQGVAVNRASELEVQFNLVSPYAFFEKNLESLYPIPKHLFADTPAANWRLSEYNLKPVGSGPYRFDSYEKRPNGFITAYHLNASPSAVGSRPLIERFVVRFFTATEELVAAFNTAAIDGFSAFDPTTLREINRPYEIVPFRLPGYYAVFMNQGQHLALKDPGVRRALSLAVDRKNLVDTALRGQGIPAGDPLAAVFPPLAGELFSSDPARILDNAGWKIGAEGIREKKIKDALLKLEFNLIVPDISFLKATAENLRLAWEKLGAKANVTTLTPEDVVKRAVKNRDYQTILFGNFLNPPFDLHPFWSSEERFYPGLNLALYNNKRADDLIETVRREMDPDARNRSLEDLRNVIVSDNPVIFLYVPDYLFVVGKDLKGIRGGIIDEPADKFREVSNWHTRTARVLK